MNILDSASEILIYLFAKRTNFVQSFHDYFETHTDVPVDDKKKIINLYGCELRHHFFFTYLLDRYCPEIKGDAYYYTCIGLSNIFFVKEFTVEDTIIWINEILKKNKIEVNEVNFKKMIDNANNEDSFIPEDVDKKSTLFLSLRFNTPSWLIKLWQKNYGFGLTFRILKANAKATSPIVRINTDKIDSAKFFENNKDFSTTIYPECALYSGGKQLRKTNPYHNYMAFVSKLAIHDFVTKLNIEQGSELFYYTEEISPLFVELALTCNETISFEVSAPGDEVNTDLKKFIPFLNKNHKIGIFNTKTEGLVTVVSKPQDIVICSPKSSHFDAIRSEPSFLLSVTPDDVDKAIVQEQKCIEECAKYVASGGLLAYVVFTINKKETTKIVNEFLLNHPEFSIQEQMQHFVGDKFDSSMYYAILRKNDE